MCNISCELVTKDVRCERSKQTVNVASEDP